MADRNRPLRSVLALLAMLGCGVCLGYLLSWTQALRDTGASESRSSLAASDVRVALRGVAQTRMSPQERSVHPVGVDMQLRLGEYLDCDMLRAADMDEARILALRAALLVGNRQQVTKALMMCLEDRWPVGALMLVASAFPQRPFDATIILEDLRRQSPEHLSILFYTLGRSTIAPSGDERLRHEAVHYMESDSSVEVRLSAAYALVRAEHVAADVRNSAMSMIMDLADNGNPEAELMLDEMRHQGDLPDGVQ